MADQKNRDAEATAASKDEESEDVKCENHPHRKAEAVDFGGATLNLCEECRAFKDA